MLSNLRVGTRMGLGFGVILLAAALMAAVALVEFARFRGEFDQVALRTVPSLESFSAMDHDLQEIRQAQLQILVEFDMDARKAQLARAAAAFASLTRHQGAHKALLTDASSVSLWKAIDEKLSASKAAFAKLEPL